MRDYWVLVYEGRSGTFVGLTKYPTRFSAVTKTADFYLRRLYVLHVRLK